MKHESDVPDEGECEGRLPFDAAFLFVCKDETGGGRSSPPQKR